MAVPDRPVVDDEDRFQFAASREEIVERQWPHRCVWVMVYSPRNRLWLVQWRAWDKDTAPGRWDMSAAGHVDCVDGHPEPYDVAFQRELREELGLEAALVPPEQLLAACGDAERCAPAVDLGYSREYHQYPVIGGRVRMEREHVHQYLALWDGPVVLPPDGEAQGLAWLEGERIESELLARDLGTPGLARTLAAARALLARIGG